MDRNQTAETANDGRDAEVTAVPAWLKEERRQLAAERAALGEARAQVEQLRTELLEAVSHELRTPLTLIRTSIGLLLDSEPEPSMRDRLLRNIKQSADRMNVLVTDLLDLARLRSRQADLHVRQVDLGELVSGATTMMRPLVEQAEQTIETIVPSPAPVILGDPRRLERVLLNLLSNATKFAPAGARIAVEVETSPEGVTISVSDTGPGIPPGAMPLLFEQFYTGRTSSSSHNIGTGLGLPIAKGIVEAHGGRIWVESEVGRGSTFRVALPWEPPREEGAGEGPRH